MPITTAMLTVLLSVVFPASAVGKLRAREQSAMAFDALRIRVPAPVAMIVLVSVVEAALAVTLLLASHWWFVAASLTSLILLGVFLVAVVRARRLGSRDQCNCFGPGTSGRIGLRLVLRNTLLVVAAGAVAAQALFSPPGQSVVTFALQPVAEGVPVAIILSTMLIAAVAFMIATGDPAPSTASSTPREAVDADAPILFVDRESGRAVDLRHDAKGKAQLAVFVKLGCTPCHDVVSAVKTAIEDLSSVVDVSIVHDQAVGTTPLDSQSADDSPFLPYLVDLGGATAARLGVWSRRPAAVLIATDGSVVQPLAGGRDEVISLIESIRAAAHQLRTAASHDIEEPRAQADPQPWLAAPPSSSPESSTVRRHDERLPQ